MSKKIENPLAAAGAFFIISAIAAMVIWPLMDLFWCNIIDHSNFEYSVGEYIVGPLIFAAVFTLIFNWKALFGKKKKK